MSHFGRSRKTLGLITLGVTTLAALGLCGPPAAQAQSGIKHTLYSFGGGSDGAYPTTGLLSLNGKLYGTTLQGGGTANSGIIFSVDPYSGAESILYSFAGQPSDGAYPEADLINVNGTLFGTTYQGGTSDEGTVFSFNPTTNAETPLHSFPTASGDGVYLFGSLLNVNGTLYGTTSIGGLNNLGTIFSINTDGSNEQRLYSFTGTSGDGKNPVSGLLNVNGLLYGSTGGGGANSNGTLFSFDPTTKAETVFYSFTGGSDGGSPLAGLLNVNGQIFGTTFSGATNNQGTAFLVNPTTDAVSTMHQFGGLNTGDSGVSRGSMVCVNGTLYGTTQYGGTSDNGTVFSIDPTTKAEKVIYSFKGGGDGANPTGSLLNINGTLYGTTFNGGGSGKGTVFSLLPVTIPVAKNDSGRGIANHTVIVGAPGVLGNDNNGGDPNTTAALVMQPAHGTLTFKADGSFTYAPNTGYVGADSFTYQDTNAAGTSSTATCSLTIGPVAYPDNGRTYFNTAVVIGAPGVLGNDATGGLTTTATLVTNPSHGTITFNSNGGFSYTPTNGFQGTDSFTYQITNAGGTSAPATCTMTVQARTPIANNDAGKVTHNTTATFAAPGVMGNDNLGSTGTVTASLVTGPSHGTLTFNSNGGFVYKPTTGYIGTDSFTYKDTNSVGTSNTATCTLTVQ